MKMQIKTLPIACLIFFAAITSGFGTTASQTCRDPGKVNVTAGMKVLAKLAGPNWSVAKLKSIKGRTFLVVYPDQGLGSLDPSEVVLHPDEIYRGNVPPCLKKGEKVLAKWQGDTWREATISKVDKDKATITFADKKQRTAKLTELVRMPR